MPRRAAGLLVAGTTSDAGKTLVVTGLCRALARRGVDVAPFKAQNMSNNSMVCPPQPPSGGHAAGGTAGHGTAGHDTAGDGTAGDGTAGDYAEIGRAQWVQALAAGVRPGPDLNPVLLKPGSDRRSHVVRDGRAAGSLDAYDFTAGREPLRRAAYAALDRLRARHELVVVEGAGSPAEINLRAGDYVNMGLARHAGLPAVVVGDIDRGGLFASCYGTVALLDAGDQALLSGFVVNKFRGEPTLLQPGVAELEQLTGRRVYGVLPWHPDVWLDSEDALDLPEAASTQPGGAAPLRVAVVRFPRISNFTDVDALALEPGVEVRFVSSPRGLADADLVVLPGTRATLADLAWLRERGLDQAVATHAAAGRPVLGICGGCQMLGERILDPDGVEGPAGSDVDGLGLLPLETTFSQEKVLGLPAGSALGEDAIGYEIHHGRLRQTGEGEEFLDGVRRGPVAGTLWHGTLESDGFRGAYLREVAATVGAAPPKLREPGDGFAAARERRLDLLGDLVEEHLDVDGLLALAREGPPADLPLLAPGAGR